MAKTKRDPWVIDLTAPVRLDIRDCRIEREPWWEHLTGHAWVDFTPEGIVIRAREDELPCGDG